METTTERQATGPRVRRRRRWGAVGVFAAVMALSGCTLDFSDGKIRAVCYESDYDFGLDGGGDYTYTPKPGVYPFRQRIVCIDCPEFPIYGLTLWP